MTINLRILLGFSFFYFTNSLNLYSVALETESKKENEFQLSKQQLLDEELYIAIIDEKISEDEREKQVADLISKGANANVVYPNNENLRDWGGYSEGITPLTLDLKRTDFAVYVFHKKIHNSGKTIFAKNTYGTGRHSSVIDRRKNNILKMLIKSGADVNFKNKNGVPTIFYALDNLEAFQILIDAGADINATDERGQSLLIYTVNEAINSLSSMFYKHEYMEYLDVISKLLLKGADITIIDNERHTVFDFANSSNLLKKMLNDAKERRNKAIKEALKNLIISDLTNLVCDY